MGVSLYATYCFPLVAFNILSVFNFCQFDLLCVCHTVSVCFSLGFFCLASLCFLGLADYFLSHVREVFPIISSNIFLGPFSLSTPSGPPITRMFCAFNVVPEVS